MFRKSSRSVVWQRTQSRYKKVATFCRKEPSRRVSSTFLVLVISSTNCSFINRILYRQKINRTNFTIDCTPLCNLTLECKNATFMYCMYPLDILRVLENSILMKSFRHKYFEKLGMLIWSLSKTISLRFKPLKKVIKFIIQQCPLGDV